MSETVKRKLREPRRIVTGTTPYGEPITDEVVTEDKTRSQLPFEIRRRIEGPDEGQVTAVIPRPQRLTQQPVKLRAFDEAVKQVQPMLDNEDIPGAVGILRDVE